MIYGRKAGLALTMEIFTPERPNRLGVVWVVSSSGRLSREQTQQPSFERRIAPLMERGYTVFAAIHGSSPEFHLQDFVSDIRRAVRFVRYRSADFGIDPERLGICGSSAGGLISLLIALHPDEGNPASGDAVERSSSRVQAVGNFFPPTDLMNFGDPPRTILDFMRQRYGTVDPSMQFYDFDRKTGGRSLITEPDGILRMLREMSPVTHVTPDDPPTILIHGNDDKIVPVQQSQRLVDRLNAAKVPARLVARENAGHAWPGWESDTASIADWFDQYLARDASRPAR